MDILSWNVKQKFGDTEEKTIGGFPTKKSAELYSDRFKFRINYSAKIEADYWEPAYRINSGELDLNVGI